MKKTQKANGFSSSAAILTALILLSSFAILFIVDALFPFRRGFMGGMMGGVAIGSGYLLLSALLTLAVLGMSVYLIYLYLQDYLRIRTTFTLGLLLVAASFMMYGLTSNPLLHSLFGLGPNAGIFGIIPSAFMVVALGLLLWISSK